MSYLPLELGLPGTPRCPDAYEAEATLLCQSAERLILQVAKNPVFIEFGIMPGGKGAGLGSVIWQTHQPLFPCMAILARQFDAIRVRNLTKGAEAQVLISVEVT